MNPWLSAAALAAGIFLAHNTVNDQLCEAQIASHKEQKLPYASEKWPPFPDRTNRKYAE